MKKLMLGMMALLLTAGCAMRAEYGIVIGKDKNVKLEYVVAQDNDFIDTAIGMNSDDDSTATITDAQRWEYLESSSNDFETYTKTKYEKDGFKGYTYTLDLGSIDDLVATSADEIALTKVDKGTKIFTKDGNVYKLNLGVDSDDKTQYTQYKDYVQFDVKLKVTLPNEAKTNNATSVEGTTYIWDLTQVDKVDLSFTIGQTNTSSQPNYALIAIICASVAVVAVGAGTFVIINKKNKEAK